MRVICWLTGKHKWRGVRRWWRRQCVRCKCIENGHIAFMDYDGGARWE